MTQVPDTIVPSSSNSNSVLIPPLHWNPIQQQIEETKQEYIDQCPLLQHQEKQEDLWKLLTIGKINDIPDLVINLASIYSRDRIKAYDDSDGETKLCLNDWVEQSPLIKVLTNNTKQKQDLIRDGLTLYFKRTRSKISFHGMEKIKDNIRPYAEYFKEAVELIQSQRFFPFMPREKSAFPWQLDLWIIPKDLHKMDINDELSEDDDDDNDDVDDVESMDIEASLKRHKLCYVKYRRDAEHKRQLKDIFFHSLKIKSQVENDWDLTRNKRIIGIVDRRCKRERVLKLNDVTDSNESKGGDNNEKQMVEDDDDIKREENELFDLGDSQEHDMVYLYYPDKANKIPHNYLSEKFIQNSCEYILDGITAQTPSGNMFLLSFHVLQEDEIKCFLFQRGQNNRMEPQHILSLWPYLFEDSEANKKFVEEQSTVNEKKNFVQNMELKDVKYERFEKIGEKKRKSSSNEEDD